MPYIPKYNQNIDDDENQKKQNQYNISGSSNVIGSSGQAVSSTNKTQGSGTFTNLQKYLDANKDSASGMADKIVGGVEQQAQAAKTNIDNFKANAPSEISTIDQSSLNNTFNNVTQLKDDEKNQYKTLKNTGGYNGPKSINEISGFNDAQASALKAQSLVDNSKTESGRQTLLQDTFKRDNYSQGAKTLDNLLVQNNQNSKAKFEGLQSNWGQLQSILDGAVNEKANVINKNINTAFNNKSEVAKAEQDYINQFKSNIDSKVKEAQTKTPELQSRLQKDLEDNILSDETLSLLGLSDGQKVYNTNLNDFLTLDQSQIGADQVATTEQRQQWQALAELLGMDNTYLSKDEKSYNPVKFDKEAFDKQVAQREAEFNNYANTQKGDFYNFINSTGKNTPQNEITGGSYWEEINQRTLNELLRDRDALKAQSTGGSVAGLRPQLIDDYIEWKQNQFGANNTVRRG